MFDRAIFELDSIKPMMAVVVALTVARALAVVGQAVGLAQAIVGVWQGNALEEQAAWIALFFCCFVARQVILAAQDHMLDRYAYRQADSLRESLLQAVFKAGPALVGRRGSAAVVNSAIEGTGHVAAYIALIIPKMTAVGIVPLVLLIAMIPLDLVSAFIALACFPFIILYMVIIGYTAKDDAAKRHGEFERMSNHFIDSLRGIDTLKAFGRSRDHAGRHLRRFRTLPRSHHENATHRHPLERRPRHLRHPGACRRGHHDGIPPGRRHAFFSSGALVHHGSQYFRPIREFASDYHASLDGRTSLAAIRETIDEACALRPQGAGSDPVLSSTALETPSVTLEDVSFDYADYTALSGISFSVKSPCKVGSSAQADRERQRF